MPQRPQHARARPLWGRISAAGSALVVTVVAVLGGGGLLPAGSAAATAPAEAAGLAAEQLLPSLPIQPGELQVGRLGHRQAAGEATAVPAGSGTGKRVVFDMSDQRVWLVDADGTTVRTYLVSGSVTDNLRPGSFAVYSTSRWATGVDDSGVMQYFVRFTRGARAAIGFHSIPTKDGRPLQSPAQLGTPQ